MCWRGQVQWKWGEIFRLMMLWSVMHRAVADAAHNSLAHKHRLQLWARECWCVVYVYIFRAICVSCVVNARLLDVWWHLRYGSRYSQFSLAESLSDIGRVRWTLPLYRRGKNDTIYVFNLYMFLFRWNSRCMPYGTANFIANI